MSEVLSDLDRAALAAMAPPPAAEAAPEPTLEEIAAHWRQNLAHVLVCQAEVADEFVSKRRVRVLAASALNTLQAMYVEALTQTMEALAEQQPSEPKSLIVPASEGIVKL